MDLERRHQLNEAVSLANRGKRRGFRALERLHAESRTPEEWMQMGDAWLRSQHLDRAIDCFLRAAHRFFEQDHERHACAMLRMILDLDPDHEARGLLAQSLEKQGHHDAAREVLERSGRELHQTGRRPGRRYLIPSAPHGRALWELRKLRRAA